MSEFTPAPELISAAKMIKEEELPSKSSAERYMSSVQGPIGAATAQAKALLYIGDAIMELAKAVRGRWK